MSRWEPNARERLERAALALFLQRGYDATTVAEIAERAGLAKSTFFRHYADKREVLFGGQDVLAGRFREAIHAVPPPAKMIDCLAAALAVIAPAFVPERRDLIPQRRAVIAANSELRERELLKEAGLASAITEALTARGLDETAAKLAGEMGVLALSMSAERWADSANRRSYAELVREALLELQARAMSLATADC